MDVLELGDGRDGDGRIVRVEGVEISDGGLGDRVREEFRVRGGDKDVGDVVVRIGEGLDVVDEVGELLGWFVWVRGWGSGRSERGDVGMVEKRDDFVRVGGFEKEVVKKCLVRLRWESGFRMGEG